ncbi:acyl-CoA dehydrogenase family protein [Amycolatopsis minnesotensis]|uniref:acyl-CoA dehydrogenase family protein n=1 Tax=Amycolatopsis minnesotensis TaxID=337894 RepID=UPI0031D8BA8F
MSRTREIEELSCSDGSAGLLAAAEGSAVLAAADPAAVAEVAGYLTASADTGGVLTARPGGGYLIAGKWDAVPAIARAGWFALAAEADGDPTARALVLLSAAELTARPVPEPFGLVAAETGEVVVDGIVVPAHRIVDLQAGIAAGFPLLSTRFPATAAVALGLARGGLGCFLDFARKRSRNGAIKPMIDDHTIQVELTRLVTGLRAARHLLHDEIAGVGERMGTGQRVRIAAASWHAYRAARAVVEFAFEKSGGSALYDGSAIQRIWCDLSALDRLGIFGVAAERAISLAQLGRYVTPGDI